jgi:hypothetical protein
VGSQADPNRRNQFSFADAREAMYAALTLRRTGLSGVRADIFPNGSGTYSERASTQRAYWATTFRALGDVLHVVQDNAQPQHTRSDQHVGLKIDVLKICGEESFYENYIEARVKGDKGFSFGPLEQVEIEKLDLFDPSYLGYPVPRVRS